MENLTEENIKKLEEYFNNTREYNGVSITKDNCEDLFEVWLEQLSEEELKNILNETRK